MKEYVDKSQLKYKTRSHLLLLGDDFSYREDQKALIYIQLWEKMMKKFDDIEVKFATPSEYFDSIFQEKKTFKVYEGDFMPLVYKPYNDDPNGMNRVWSGYYNTKPYIKSLISQVQKNTRNAEILSALTHQTKITAYELSTTTHHDAITGTCKYPVYLDYIKRLKHEDRKMLNYISESAKDIFDFKKIPDKVMVPYKVLIIFNPLNWMINKLISFELKSQYFRIFDSNAKVFVCEGIFINNQTQAFFRLELESFQLKVLFVEESSTSCADCNKDLIKTNETLLINNKMSIIMNEGLIKTLNYEGKTIDINQNFVNYDTSESGAYLFTPLVKII